MNESTLVPRQEMSDLDWLARNVHEWHCEHQRVAVVSRSTGYPSAYFPMPEHNSFDCFTYGQWLARRAELQNKPSCMDAPEWAKFLSQSVGGAWYWHELKPKKGTCLYFNECGKYMMHCEGEVLGDWRDTLEKRPADLSEQAVTSRLKEATDNVLAAVPELMTDKYKFEPFVSAEDAGLGYSGAFDTAKEYLSKCTERAATAKQPEITTSKYTKTIHGVSVDVYDVLQAWGVSNPALQHLIKKALQCGQRGHKDNAQDLQDIIDSAIRAKELEC